MNPPPFADGFTAPPSDDEAREIERMMAAAEDEEGIAAFGRWYESQPAEWIADMDEIGRMGAREKP